MKFLIIQTSFIGDVITATAVAEKLHQYFPEGKIDMLVRKGNEGLLVNHPFLNRVLIWDKKEGKISNLFKLIGEIRAEKYDVVINLHRFLSTGIITAFSGAKDTRGFQKNPFSFLFKKTFVHRIGDGTTEYARNQQLIIDLTDSTPAKPKLYPIPLSAADGYKSPYVCIAPASVWFTKQLPQEKWIELIERIPTTYTIYLIGAKSDFDYAERIKTTAKHPAIVNLAGSLNFLQSATLMKGAKMNYVNDSAPLHICSAMNAPVTAFFLSTTPLFGFVPVSDQSVIVETTEKLECKPCGIHGYMKCPQGHFRCALTIDMNKVEIV